MRYGLIRHGNVARAKRVLLAIAAGVGVSVAAPLTTSAAVTVPGGGCAPSSNVTLCWQGVGQAVPVGTATEDVTATCTTITEGVVESTGVGCYLLGKDGTTIYSGAGVLPVDLFTPGNQSTNVVVGQNIPIQPYQLCIGSGYLGLDGTLVEWAFVNCVSPL